MKASRLQGVNAERCGLDAFLQRQGLDPFIAHPYGHGARFLSAAIRFAAGVEHQVNEKGGLCLGTPQFLQRAEAVTLCKPDIWVRDQ